MLEKIPHWNPIKEAIKILERYIEMVGNNEEILKKREELQTLLKNSFDEVKKNREIFINK
jgi:hypothetical protein